MEVKLYVIIFLCVVSKTVYAKNVKSKNDTWSEDTYGALADEEPLDDEADSDYPIEDIEESNDTIRNEPEVQEMDAKILSEPQEFIASVNDTVMLPCNVSNSDAVHAWIKGINEFLYQGEVAVRETVNLRQHRNRTLEIKLLSDRDFGTYTCKILIHRNPEENPLITHTVVKRTAPQINALFTSNNGTVYHIGDTLTLTCRAEGYPKPKISWHKDNERLGTEGETLTITDLKFKNSGMYRCLADNGISPVSHRHINIDIEHKPVVYIEKYIVNSDKEEDAELKCTVRAYPPATIIWKKEGRNIIAVPAKRHFFLKRNSNNIESILTIKNLTDEDFGKYTCAATNNLEKVEKTVSLVQIPAVQQFAKPEKTNKDVSLSWKVESKAPISQHELQYRKKGEQGWKQVSPEQADNKDDIYTVKYTLKNIEGGTYETRVRAQNAHGWSEYSDIFPFDGVLAKHGSHHKQHNKKHHKEKDTKETQALMPEGTPAQHQENEHKSSIRATQVTLTSSEGTPAQHQENDLSRSSVGESKTDGCAAVISSVPMISIALLILFINRQ